MERCKQAVLGYEAKLVERDRLLPGGEAGARAKIVSFSTHDYVDPNPGRTAKRKAKREKLQTILGRFNELPIEDYMNMLIAHFNDD